MSRNKSIIILVRHGETVWNKKRKFQGNKNSLLTDTGVSQAAETGKLLENIHIDSVYSSPLMRAFNTAEIITKNRNLKISTRDNLREIFLGPWEGEYLDYIEISDPCEYNNFWNHPDRFSLKGAESFYDLQKRIVNEIKQILKENTGKTVLTVSHWIAIKTAAAFFKGIEMSSLNRLFNLPNGKFFILTEEEGNIRFTDRIYDT